MQNEVVKEANPYLTETIEDKIARYRTDRQKFDVQVSKFTHLLSTDLKTEAKKGFEAKLARAKKNLASCETFIEKYDNKKSVKAEIERLEAKQAEYQRRSEVLKTKIKNLKDWLPRAK